MRLAEISTKLRSQARLTRDDALALFATEDVLEAAHIAAEQSALINGRRVYYNENRLVRTKPMPKPWGDDELSRPMFVRVSTRQDVEQMIERATRLVTKSTTEIRFGSINPKLLGFDMLLGSIKALRKRFPRIRIRALCAPDVDAYTRHEGVSIERILAGLLEAGTSYLDGRGAGIFGFKHPGQAAPMAGELWFKIHRAAHRMGFVSDATMVYGLGESHASRVDHLLALRDLQDETHGFVSFIPLASPVQEPENGFYRRTIGVDDIKTFAASRLVLDNIQNIRANWGRLGMDMAQLILECGANELEGSVSNDNNSRIAGARSFRAMNRNEIESLIKKTGQTPEERDGFYQPVKRREGPTSSHDEGSLSRLLYKVEKGHELDEEEAILIASSASLTALGYCAQVKKQGFMSTKHGSFVTHAWELESLITNPALTFQDIMINEPKIATLDLGLAMQSVSDISLKSVIETLNGAKSHHWPLQIVVKGVKSLFLVARNSGQTMEGLLKALVEANVTTIESSSYEAEDDLTISEVVQTHKAIHQCDIQSVAKVELQASYNGTALAFWRSFVQRLMAIIRLQSSSHGLVGIKVEAAKGSRISPAEYLRAVAVARILSHNISNVICPFVKIPSLAHSMDPDKAVRSRDTLKLAPICLFFGANDLDYVRLDSVNTRLISGELQKSGFVTVLRDARFNLTSSSSPGPGVDFTG